jgi:sugar transferase (PEP-CTERM/EpsH1 system associated)
MRLLVLSSVIPFPPVGGGHLRAFHFLRALAARHEVTLVGFSYGDDPPPPPFPVRVVAVPWERPPLYRELGEAATWQSARDTLTNQTDHPLFVSYFESPAMDETLRRVTQDPFDLILIITTQMARFLPALPRGIPKVLDFWNVETLVTRRSAEAQSGEERARTDLEARKMLQFEKMAASHCALCLTVSDLEASTARSLLGIDRVEVIPNVVDTAFFTPQAEDTPIPHLLFTGTMYYAPNIQAAQHFTARILPLVRERIPGVKFQIVGMNPAQEVFDLSSDNVTVHGFVPDLRPFYRRAKVVVVPLLQGGGTRLKILEAAASGKAIVSTSIGAEGLSLAAGEDIVIADSETDFANAVVALASNEERRKELGRRARMVARQHDWEGIGMRLCEAVEAVVRRDRPVVGSISRSSLGGMPHHGGEDVP